MFILEMFIIVKNWKQLKCLSLGDWLKETNNKFPYHGILTAITVMPLIGTLTDGRTRVPHIK